MRTIVTLTFFSLTFLLHGQRDSIDFGMSYPQPGPYKEYYKSGKLKVEGTYKRVDSIECVNCFDKGEGHVRTRAHSKLMRTGEWKEYYESGQLKASGLYKGIHEIYISTYPKDYGKETFKTYFIPGDYSEEYLKDKTWKYYNESGQLIREEYYFKGTLSNRDVYER